LAVLIKVAIFLLIVTKGAKNFSHMDIIYQWATKKTNKSRIHEVTPIQRKNRIYSHLQNINYTGNKTKRNHPSHKHLYTITDLAFIPRSTSVLCGDMKGGIYLMDSYNHQQQFKYLSSVSSSINKMTINNGRCCLVTSMGGVYVYDLETMKPIVQYNDHRIAVTDVKYEHGMYLTSSLDGSCNIYHPDVKSSLLTIFIEGNTHSCTFVPDKPYQIITASEKFEETGSTSIVKLYDIRYNMDYVNIINNQYKEYCKPLWHNVPVVENVSDDYEDDEDDWSWGSSWSSQRNSQSKQKREDIIYSPSSVVSSDKYVYNNAFKRYDKTFSDHDNSKRIYHVTCTPRGHLLTSSCDSTHKLWNLSTRQGIMSYEGCKKDTYTTPVPVFIRDYDQLVSGDSNGNLCIYNTYRTSNSYSDNYVYKMKIHSSPISAIAANEYGDCIACSDDLGNICLIGLGDDQIIDDSNVKEMNKHIDDDIIPLLDTPDCSGPSQSPPATTTIAGKTKSKGLIEKQTKTRRRTRKRNIVVINISDEDSN
jgi:hypothetical protein